MEGFGHKKGTFFFEKGKKKNEERRGGLHNLIGPTAFLSKQPVGTVGNKTSASCWLVSRPNGGGQRFSKAEPRGGSPAPFLRGGSRLLPSISDRRKDPVGGVFAADP